MALSANGPIPVFTMMPIPPELSAPSDTSVNVFAGGLVAYNPANGYVADVLGTAPTVIVAGVAQNGITTASAQSTIVYQQAYFDLLNGTSGDVIAAANVPGLCYAIDDQTVGLTDNAGARPIAGIVVGGSHGNGFSVKVAVRTELNWLLQALRTIIAPQHSASVNRGPGYWLHKAFSAPGAGGQDVTLLAANTLPNKLRVIDCFLQVGTSGAGVTATFRDQAAGAGTALSSALSLNATGTARNDDTASRLTAAPGASVGLFLRISDGTSVVGDAWIHVANEN